MIHPVPCCCDRAPEIVVGTGATNWYVGVTISGGDDQILKLKKTDGATVAISTSVINTHRFSAIDSNQHLYWLAGASLRRHQFDGTLDWSYTDAEMSRGSSCVAVDNFGNSYFCGNRPDGSLSHFRAVKVDNTGALVWDYEKTDPGTGAGFGVGGADPGWASVSNQGTVHFSNVYDSNQQAEFELDLDGNEIWSSFGALTFGTVCVHDDSGNVIVNGNSPDGTHSFTIYDTTGTVSHRILDADTPSLPDRGHDNGMIEWFDGKLYIIRRDPGLTEFTVRRLSGASYGTTDWVTTVTATTAISPAPRLAVDSQGDVYVTWDDSVSATSVCHWRKLNGSDGSEIYSDSISNASDIGFPMIPPGRPTIFI